MYRKQVRRRRAVLLLLVVALADPAQPLLPGGSGGPLHRVQRGVAAVLGPFEEGADRALKPARDFVNWFDETFEARGENETLKDEVAEACATSSPRPRPTPQQGEELAKLAELHRRGPGPARASSRSPRG